MNPPEFSLGLTAARIEEAGTVNARLIDGGRLSHGGDVLPAAVVTQGARELKLCSVQLQPGPCTVFNERSHCRHKCRLNEHQMNFAGLGGVEPHLFFLSIVSMQS